MDNQPYDDMELTYVFTTIVAFNFYNKSLLIVKSNTNHLIYTY